MVVSSPLTVSKGIIKTALGALGYLYCQGTAVDPTTTENKTPILCFHSSPRNSDEYLEVLPLLAASGRTVVALDMPGYGMSENPTRSCSMDDIANAFLEVADSLEIKEFCTIGCLMGCFPAVSLASRYPERVKACIQANLFYYPTKASPTSNKDDDNDNDIANKPIPDSFELEDDGSHLMALHNKRKWLDPALNMRVVQGEMTYLINRRVRYANGISIQDLSSFDFETPAKAVTCPTLCVRGESCLSFFDAIGYSGTQQFEAGSKLFPNVQIASLEGEKSTLNMINQMP
eukprot:CAMPEP_0198143896 /NCGR_PEP_ID=MMETSP1443-20131203/11514_1 /TAXON_ID=186043 /ORGANISM="Entomoneis sp., Strain CCMP2396" /LENGTH=288 /DNA_ID=CAMNT_0043807201 /DNA_START=20 /DNA_END=883 /DNA_ORIENTATION=+